MGKRKKSPIIPDPMGRKAGPIGARVKHWREKRGLTLDELHDLSKVARTTIATLESGQRTSVTTKTLEKLAQALRVDISALTESEVAISPIEPAIQAFLADPYGQITKPTEDELAILRGSPKAMWDTWRPTPRRLHLLIMALRDDNKP